jgi:EamA-like transporter family protein
LLVISLARGRLPVFRPRTIRFHFVCAFLGYLVPYFLALFATGRIDADIVTLITLTSPIITLCLASLVGIERVSATRVLGIGLGLVSVLFLIVPQVAGEFHHRHRRRLLGDAPARRTPQPLAMGESRLPRGLAVPPGDWPQDRSARSATGQRLKYEHFIAVADGIGQAYGIGDAGVVHIDVHVSAQAALVVENVGAQPGVRREHIVEYGADAGARRVLNRTSDVPL